MRQQPKGRVAIVTGALVLALLCILFPPWRVRAIRTTTRYAAVSGVAPATVVDTVPWTLSFEPLLAPPRQPIPGEAAQRLADRAATGDAQARAELRRVMNAFEERYRAPEVIRTSGELWRDSVLAAAGVPAVSSYDARFSIDDRLLVGRLAAIVGIAALLEYRRRRRAGSL